MKVTSMLWSAGCRQLAAGLAVLLALDPTPMVAQPALLLSQLDRPEPSGTRLIGVPTLQSIRFSLEEPAGGASVESLSEVSLDERGVYLVVRWGGYLEKGTRYRVLYRSRDESGKILLTSHQYVIPEVDSWRSWQWFALRDGIDEPGLWTFEVILDGRKVAERRLRVLSAP